MKIWVEHSNTFACWAPLSSTSSVHLLPGEIPHYNIYNNLCALLILLTLGVLSKRCHKSYPSTKSTKKVPKYQSSSVHLLPGEIPHYNTYSNLSGLLILLTLGVLSKRCHKSYPLTNSPPFTLLGNNRVFSTKLTLKPKFLKFPHSTSLRVFSSKCIPTLHQKFAEIFIQALP